MVTTITPRPTTAATATGAEVLKGNRRNVRLAGRLANARQLAEFFSFFIFFLFFMSTLLFLLAQLANAYRRWAQLFS